MTFRHHINFHGDDGTPTKGAASNVHAPTMSKERFTHLLHYDASRKNTDLGETQTGRGVATIHIDCTVQEMRVFKMRITDLSETTPIKTGDPSFDFPTIVGNPFSPPYLYIITGQEVVIVTGLHKEVEQVLLLAGYST